MEADLCAAESGADVDSLGPECKGRGELAAGCDPAGADKRNRELLCALWMASTAPVKIVLACNGAHGTADTQEQEQEQQSSRRNRRARAQQEQEQGQEQGQEQRQKQGQEQQPQPQKHPQPQPQQQP